MTKQMIVVFFSTTMTLYLDRERLDDSLLRHFEQEEELYFRLISGREVN